MLLRNCQPLSVNRRRLRRAASKCLEFEGFLSPAEVSIVLVDDPRIQAMNRQYRGLDRPTDVMAFSQLEGVSVESPGLPVFLGDIVISVETAQRQAEENGLSAHEELDLLVVHGILHLLGYDDETDAGASEMRRHEKLVLDKLKDERQDRSGS